MSTLLPVARRGALAKNEAVHRLLAASHAKRLSPSSDSADFEADLATEIYVRRVERTFVEAERQEVSRQIRTAPTESTQFVNWFEGLERTGPGQHDALFAWLSEHATHQQMSWFLRQELAGEAGFDDLVALTQVKLPTHPKLEMARNYWDEMGQGNEGGMHGPMLNALAGALHLEPGTDTVWESLALSNLMVALATARHYAYLSVGALGVIELTAPGRSRLVNAGLKRLGIGGAARRYYALHATLDVRHSATWNREVLKPLVASDPAVVRLIAEGALLRLRAGERCFERYRRELWAHAEPTAGAASA